MEENETVAAESEDKSIPMTVKFAKFAVGIIAASIATHYAEKGIDKFFSRKPKTETETTTTTEETE